QLDQLVAAATTMKGNSLQVILDTLASVGTEKTIGVLEGLATKNAVKALGRCNNMIAVHALSRLLTNAQGTDKVLIVRAFLQVLQVAPVHPKDKRKLLIAALPHAGRDAEKKQVEEAMRR
ncbi:MAG: hypothetical protein HRT88_22730, partial [Lentisphaeraceae bacterium]|nr:hypothetical protein [Lentisphaeraceae bacterium]